MMTAVQRVCFSAGHRLLGHEGKCSSLHGHNYVAYFHATADKLDAMGRVVDFSVLKQRLGVWVNTHWDHGFVCHKEDQEARKALAHVECQKVFWLDGNPTAENMAAYLLHTVSPRELADTGVRVVRVVLWETENCCAEASL